MRRVTSFIKDYSENGNSIQMLNEVFTDENKFHINSFILSDGKLDFNEFKIPSLNFLKLFFNEVHGNLPLAETKVFWFSEGSDVFYPEWLEGQKFSSKKILRLAV
jgi:hypothetical protein